MNTTHSNEARKRAVNLSLSEDLVVQARALTSNLSGIVESPLADYVEQDRQRRLAKANTTQATIDMWNGFNAKHGSFAAEYSSL